MNRKPRKTLQECIDGEKLPKGYKYYRALPSEVEKLKKGGWSIVHQKPDLRVE